MTTLTDTTARFRTSRVHSGDILINLTGNEENSIWYAKRYSLKLAPTKEFAAILKKYRGF